MEKIILPLIVMSFTAGFSVANLLVTFTNSTVVAIASIAALVASVWAVWKC